MRPFGPCTSSYLDDKKLLETRTSSHLSARSGWLILEFNIFSQLFLWRSTNCKYLGEMSRLCARIVSHQSVCALRADASSDVAIFAGGGKGAL